MSEQDQDNPEFEIFFDGDCPLCRREIEWLARKDSENRIRFSDIASKDFCASTIGKTQQELMQFIHGRILSGANQGQVITGVEVFRNVYSRVGWRWAVAISRFIGVAQCLDLAYWIFAKNRLRITGRFHKKCDSACDVDSNQILHSKLDVEKTPR